MVNDALVRKCACSKRMSSIAHVPRSELPQVNTMNRTAGANANLPYAAIVIAIVALGAVCLAYAYWPGVMIDDARWQYQQAVDNKYEDWHPPLMAWIWRRLMFVQQGPGPMFDLQLGLYWSGIVLLASCALKRGRPRLGVALASVGLIPAPFALTGTVTKDALMAGALGCSAGLIVWQRFAHDSRPARVGLAFGIILTLLFAAALRLNAFLACVPLAVAALPSSFRATKLRMAGVTICAGIALLLVGPLANALLKAEKTGVELSLIIFDLGGITEHSGKSQFPDLQVTDPVAVNHRCYDPYQWDSYSDWAKTPCPLGFATFQQAVDDKDLHPVRIWVRAILTHPLAYAEHRLSHFNRSTWFLVPRGPKGTAWTQSVPNPWGFRVRDNAVLRTVNAVTESTGITPLGWPVFWIAVGGAALIIGWAARASAQAMAITASATFYGLGFLFVGVATGMRYYTWTITGAAVGTLLIAADIMRRERRVPRHTLWFSLAVAAVPTSLAAAARVLS